MSDFVSEHAESVHEFDEVSGEEDSNAAYDDVFQSFDRQQLETADDKLLQAPLRVERKPSTSGKTERKELLKMMRLI